MAWSGDVRVGLWVSCNSSNMQGQKLAWLDFKSNNTGHEGLALRMLYLVLLTPINHTYTEL